MRELFRDPYLSALYDSAGQILWSVRSTEPFPSIEQGVKSWSLICDTFDRVGRAGRCYMSDLRAGPARNDPEFEQAIFKLLPRLHAGFLRNAVLVRMAVGALQIQRHARKDGITRLVTTNEEEALHYLRTGLLEVAEAHSEATRKPSEKSRK